MGGVRRLARESLANAAYVPLVQNVPTLTENWTTQRTTSYNALLPADSPSAWTGTLTDLDRVLTATGSTTAALGALLTFVAKPDSVAGPIVKVQVSFTTGSACALEVWTKAGATWTKRRRVAVAGVVRSGETIVLDLSGFIVLAANCDAIWITLAPDIGTETLTWTCLHLYGICNDDPITPDCPPGTPPEDCDEPACTINIDTGTCEDDPTILDPDVDPPPVDPFVFPPLIVKIPNPTTFVIVGNQYRHTCPRPFKILMSFGDLPSGGSVTVTPVPISNVTFTQGASQTISAAGDMLWTVATGYPAPLADGTSVIPTLYPAALVPTTDFIFTRKLAGVEALVALGNLLDILTYFWTAQLSYEEVC